MPKHAADPRLSNLRRPVRALPRDICRARAAVDAKDRAPIGSSLQQSGKRRAYIWTIAFEVDQHLACQFRAQHLVQCRHQANTRAAQRERHAMRAIAVADIERFERCHVLFMGNPAPVGQAIDTPVMKDCKPVFRRQMHVDFDHIRPKRISRPDRRQTVLNLAVGQRQDRSGPAGFTCAVRACIDLMNAAMRDNAGFVLRNVFKTRCFARPKRRQRKSFTHQRYCAAVINSAKLSHQTTTVL